jgi:serine/threonine protein kinase
MPRFGKNLDTVFEARKNRFSSKTIFMLGIKLVEIFELIHAAGFTYNDLKLDNIVIGDSNFSWSSLHQIRLIDFGFVEKFRDQNGTHIEQMDIDVFRGNMIFATTA